MFFSSLFLTDICGQEHMAWTFIGLMIGVAICFILWTFYKEGSLTCCKYDILHFDIICLFIFVLIVIDTLILFPTFIVELFVQNPYNTISTSLYHHILSYKYKCSLKAKEK